MGCRMSKKTGKRGKTTNNKEKQMVTSAAETQEATSTLLGLGDIQNMKRAQLQKLCKQFGLKASGKNSDLISRLEECQKEASISSNKVKQLPLSPKITAVVDENGKQSLDNITFEIFDSQIPVDEHVHISSCDNSPSEIVRERVSSSRSRDCRDIPDSTTEGKEQGKVHVHSDIVLGLRQVLSECNHRDKAGSKPQTSKRKINACTRWCVVEGLMKQENTALWRQIHLVGGKPMVSNSFGKRIPFILDPCGLATPENCDDNYICNNCVQENESALRRQGNSQVLHSSVTPQDTESELGILCSTTPTSSTHSLLTSLSRIGSVKRKRSDDANSSIASSSADSDQLEKKRKKDNVIQSTGSTPASPQVRRARGEQFVLPRNLQKPWRPKKTMKTSQATVKEDTEFARRVEEIIKNTLPGSEEEMFMIMSSKSSKIQRSPTKL